MGYYSDVCLVLSVKGLEDLNCRIEAMDKGIRLAVVDMLDSCDVYEEHEGESIHIWRDLKWYSWFSDVSALMGALCDMDEAGYYFLEVHEDGTEDWMGDLDNVFMPFAVHSITYTSRKPELPK